MNKPPPATNFKFSVLIALLIFCPLFFCACSDDPTNISLTQAYLVFDWQDAENPPDQRLCVFSEFLSNVRRLESISVRKDSFLWNIDAPVLLKAGHRQWAGGARLEPPVAANGTAGVFEQGSYSVEGVDAAGKKAASNFNLSYNNALLEAKAGEVKDILSGATRKVAVYSDSNELLYYDAPKDNWIDSESIFKGVKNSSFYRETLSTGNVVCFMPKIFKDGEKLDGLE